MSSSRRKDEDGGEYSHREHLTGEEHPMAQDTMIAHEEFFRIFEIWFRDKGEWWNGFCADRDTDNDDDEESLPCLPLPGEA